MDKALIGAHQRLSHGHRIERLADEFVERIGQLVTPHATDPIRILDVGCGDMTLSDAVEHRLGSATIRCVDVHPCPAERVAADPRWKRYSMFDGRRLDFDEDAFDVVLLSDVLHHVSPVDRAPLLASAARVGRYVLVKDHLEYGWFSRQMLRAMDFVGNWGYGVPIPERYFDRVQIESLLRGAGMQPIRMDVGIELYGHLPLVRHVLSADWQVIVIASRHAS